jgi:hypothetical protein
VATEAHILEERQEKLVEIFLWVLHILSFFFLQQVLLDKVLKL